MRKKSALIALAILALSLIGTSLSALYQQQDEQTTEITADEHMSTFKVSHGLPVGWYGYTQTRWWSTSHTNIPYNPPEIYWFSLESLLLDAAFWFAISFFVCIATMKSVNKLRKTRASKISRSPLNTCE
jgi:hypothetical protein